MQRVHLKLSRSGSKVTCSLAAVTKVGGNLLFFIWLAGINQRCIQYCIYTTAPTYIICRQGEMFPDRRNANKTQHEVNISLSLLDHGSLFFLLQQAAFYAVVNILRLLGDKCRKDARVIYQIKQWRQKEPHQYLRTN